jgi:hypothetical protein
VSSGHKAAPPSHLAPVSGAANRSLPAGHVNLRADATPPNPMTAPEREPATVGLAQIRSAACCWVNRSGVTLAGAGSTIKVPASRPTGTMNRPSLTESAEGGEISA